MTVVGKTAPHHARSVVPHRPHVDDVEVDEEVVAESGEVLFVQEGDRLVAGLVEVDNKEDLRRGVAQLAAEVPDVGRPM